jgi:hypothetical protein
MPESSSFGSLKLISCSRSSSVNSADGRSRTC